MDEELHVSSITLEVVVNEMKSIVVSGTLLYPAYYVKCLSRSRLFCVVLCQSIVCPYHWMRDCSSMETNLGNWKCLH